VIESASELADYIVSRTNQEWQENAFPYLLSRISPELDKSNVDYKPLIAPQTLKNFTLTLGDRVRLVQHPLHRARIGLVPAHVDFEFDSPNLSDVSSPAAPRSDSKRRLKVQPRYAVLNFLEALAELTPEEVDKVQIPISVLAKIVKNED
jgi:hypothetical protein